jgi:hypothetical protein
MALSLLTVANKASSPDDKSINWFFFFSEEAHPGIGILEMTGRACIRGDPVSMAAGSVAAIAHIVPDDRMKEFEIAVVKEALFQSIISRSLTREQRTDPKMIGPARDDFEELWKGIFEQFNDLWEKKFGDPDKPWEK